MVHEPRARDAADPCWRPQGCAVHQDPGLSAGCRGSSISQRSSINVQSGDFGGEMDPDGADLVRDLSFPVECIHG